MPSHRSDREAARQALADKLRTDMARDLTEPHSSFPPKHLRADLQDCVALLDEESLIALSWAMASLQDRPQEECVRQAPRGHQGAQGAQRGLR